jgi:outer membrane receptor protein involved in Fe transport
VFGVYETDPIAGDATVQFRMDGQYRSSINFSINPIKDLYADGSNAAGVLGTDGYMLVNGRVALRHLKIGPAEAELALWGKNLTNRKDATFALALGAPSTSKQLPCPAHLRHRSEHRFLR